MNKQLTGFILGVSASIAALHGYHLWVRQRLARMVLMAEEECLYDWAAQHIDAQENYTEEDEE